MGMAFGKFWVETPKFELLEKRVDYEIRIYSPSVVAEFTFDPSVMTGMASFWVLANYIGAFAKPKNTAPEKIAMTAPVVMSSDEKTEKTETMTFVLPGKYTRTEDAPRPVDERIVVRDEVEKKYGVLMFAGSATKAVVAKKVERLREVLERDGFKVIGGYKLALYNPPWTLPPFRTMEDMLPIE